MYIFRMCTTSRKRVSPTPRYSILQLLSVKRNHIININYDDKQFSTQSFPPFFDFSSLFLHPFKTVLYQTSRVINCTMSSPRHIKKNLSVEFPDFMMSNIATITHTNLHSQIMNWNFYFKNGQTNTIPI